MNLKDKNTEQLYESLTEIVLDWSPEKQRQLALAYDIALRAHADDYHKDRPYSEHLLRVASRLANYLEIKDPDVIIAGLLHDIVEDHALDIIDGSLLGNNCGAVDELTEAERQTMALQRIGTAFSPDITTVVEAVTNAPKSELVMTYEQKLQAYVDKVALAIRSPQAWLVKFADWCDNGLGVNYDLDGQGDKHDHFVRKYGLVLPVLMARFEEPDIQAMLSDNAKQYVKSQFAIGMKRLLPGVPIVDV